MPVPDDLLGAVVRGATPIGLAAIGELVVERSGVINIGLEGAISVGAVVATVAAAAAGPAAGLLAGAGAGLALSLVFGLFVTRLRAQQVIAGTAISMLGLGIAATMHRSLLAGTDDVHVPTLPSFPVPGFDRLPLIGSAFFDQPVPTYVLYLIVPLVAGMLYRTVAGVALRAVGESPLAARGAGRDPQRIQIAAITFGGMLAGLAGATLVVAQAGVFADGISAGRGFIAIAVVTLGGWTVRGVVAGSLLFGAVSATQYLVQSYGSGVPYNLLLAMPYVVTLVALAALRGAQAAPAALGRAIEGPP